MRYIYNIKDNEGNRETLQAMSYKKLVKKLRGDPNSSQNKKIEADIEKLAAKLQNKL